MNDLEFSQEIFDYLKSLTELKGKTETNLNLYTDGEGDSNQTKYELWSNRLMLGVLAPNEYIARCMAFHLRMLIDRNWQLFQFVVYDTVKETKGIEDINSDEFDQVYYNLTGEDVCDIIAGGDLAQKIYGRETNYPESGHSWDYFREYKVNWKEDNIRWEIPESDTVIKSVLGWGEDETVIERTVSEIPTWRFQELKEIFLGR